MNASRIVWTYKTGFVLTDTDLNIILETEDIEVVRRCTKEVKWLACAGMEANEFARDSFINMNLIFAQNAINGLGIPVPRFGPDNIDNAKAFISIYVQWQSISLS